MPTDNRPNRQSTRLRSFDYGSAGAYFLTICAYQRECLFGEIIGGKMRLNVIGEIIEEEWQRTGEIRENVSIDQFVVMPNHFHGIIFIHDVGASRWDARPPGSENPTRACRRHAPTGLKSGGLGSIINHFKAAVTRHAKHPTPVWQRNYHDHVIRNERALAEIRDYVMNNPLRWELDRNYPGNM